ncbi:hypothetical protein J3459_008521 [Metarhizium acridum]|nr:hypothetical protein J3458_000569 [Metarhizium acridum]KAG8426018.1 hypothetical protein J3459_008521 [Metarhizium acridum]
MDDNQSIMDDVQDDMDDGRDDAEDGLGTPDDLRQDRQDQQRDAAPQGAGADQEIQESAHHDGNHSHQSTPYYSQPTPSIFLDAAPTPIDEQAQKLDERQAVIDKMQKELDRQRMQVAAQNVPNMVRSLEAVSNELNRSQNVLMGGPSLRINAVTQASQSLRGEDAEKAAMMYRLGVACNDIEKLIQKLREIQLAASSEAQDSALSVALQTSQDAGTGTEGNGPTGLTGRFNSCRFGDNAGTFSGTMNAGIGIPGLGAGNVSQFGRNFVVQETPGMGNGDMNTVQLENLMHFDQYSADHGNGLQM